MRVSSRWLFVGFAAIAAAFAPLACDGFGPLEIVVRPGTEGDGGPQPDAANHDGSQGDDGGDGDGGDAGTSPVVIGLSATPQGDGLPTPTDVISARIQALAAGARGAVLRRAPKDLVGDPALASLSEEAAFYAERGAVLALSVPFVDGAVRGLPPELAGLSWSAPEVVAKTRASIDAALGVLDKRARFIVLGRDLDVYVAAFPSERASLEAFAEDLVAYVHEHPLAPPDVVVGVGFSFVGVSSADASFEALRGVTDVVVVSYLPGLGSPEAGLTSALPIDVDTMIVRSSGKPVVIESIGYPSSAVVGSSDAKQALFFDTLFDALAPRRSGFAFVNVDALHDLGPLRCASFVTERGELVGSVFADFACSLGIVSADGAEKPAWSSFLKGAAAFASP